jgi:hypothetical protein
MLLTPEIVTIEILDSIFILFATITFFIAIYVVLYWDRNSFTNKQYHLQMQSYLGATIIKFIFYLKIPLFLFFVYTLDSIANLLPGAMCGAGVVNATVYGTPLLFLKILNIYLFGYWIVLHKEDMQTKTQTYIRLKFFVYIVAYFLLLSEIFLEFKMFGGLDVSQVVDCCGAIFSTTDSSYLAEILGMNTTLLLSLFYGTFIAMSIAFFLKKRYLFSLINLFYLIISLIALIAFFGTYIYELPTHHCPFCMLQKDYHYIGYLLYIMLYLGTFYGLLLGFIDFRKEKEELYRKISFTCNTFYLFLVSYFPLSFYIKNGVWLS